MARTIGQMEKGIVLQDLADTREIDRDFERELERAPEEREQSLPGSRVFRGKGGLWYTSIGGIGYSSPEAARAGEALETIINNDDVTLTPELVEVINDSEMRITRNGEITRKVPRISGRDVIRRSGQFSLSNILPDLPSEKTTQRKKKRKTSKYQREFGKQMKALIAKHPRTKVTQLMKRAHRATKKALK